MHWFKLSEKTIIDLEDIYSVYTEERGPEYEKPYAIVFEKGYNGNPDDKIYFNTLKECNKKFVEIQNILIKI